MSVIKDIEINNGSGTPVTADLGGSAANIDYSGTTSGLSSTNVQNAIDEVVNQNNKFVGTQAQWDALSTAQKQAYAGKPVIITDDFNNSLGHAVYNESGTLMTQRDKIQFTGSSVSVTDDTTNHMTVVTVSSGGGGDAYEDEVETTFSADGKTITEVFSTGTKTTVFNNDGTITETYPDGRVFLTTFNNDGSISKEEVITP